MDRHWIAARGTALDCPRCFTLAIGNIVGPGRSGYITPVERGWTPRTAFVKQASFGTVNAKPTMFLKGNNREKQYLPCGWLSRWPQSPFHQLVSAIVRCPPGRRILSTGNAQVPECKLFLPAHDLSCFLTACLFCGFLIPCGLTTRSVLSDFALSRFVSTFSVGILHYYPVREDAYRRYIVSAPFKEWRTSNT